MAQFGTIFLTNLGADLLSKVEAGGELTFTRLAVGDGVWPNGGVNNPAMTALVGEQISVLINTVAALGGGMANISAAILVDDLLADGFEGRELGIFATDPDAGEILFCAAYAGDLYDWFPSSSEAASYEHVYNIGVAIGNATTVTVQTPPTSVFITFADFQNHIAETYQVRKDIAVISEDGEYDFDFAAEGLQVPADTNYSVVTQLKGYSGNYVPSVSVHSLATAGFKIQISSIINGVFSKMNPAPFIYCGDGVSYCGDGSAPGDSLGVEVSVIVKYSY